MTFDKKFFIQQTLQTAIPSFEDMLVNALKIPLCIRFRDIYEELWGDGYNTDVKVLVLFQQKMKKMRDLTDAQINEEANVVLKDIHFEHIKKLIRLCLEVNYKSLLLGTEVPYNFYTRDMPNAMQFLKVLLKNISDTFGRDPFLFCKKQPNGNKLQCVNQMLTIVETSIRNTINELSTPEDVMDYYLQMLSVLPQKISAKPIIDTVAERLATSLPSTESSVFDPEKTSKVPKFEGFSRLFGKKKKLSKEDLEKQTDAISDLNSVLSEEEKKKNENKMNVLEAVSNNELTPPPELPLPSLNNNTQIIPDSLAFIPYKKDTQSVASDPLEENNLNRNIKITKKETKDFKNLGIASIVSVPAKRRKRSSKNKKHKARAKSLDAQSVTGVITFNNLAKIPIKFKTKNKNKNKNKTKISYARKSNKRKTPKVSKHSKNYRKPKKSRKAKKPKNSKKSKKKRAVSK